MPNLLEVKDLTKSYGSKKSRVEAVRGVSFTIPEGICFGLLGPNGAGKTTTIEIIEGIQAASSGAIFYRGEKAGPKFHERIGIQFQHTSLPDYLTVREVLELFSRFYKRPASIQDLAERCALGDFLDRDNGKLSGGQKQRLLLALGLINDPELVFLDEPTTGLDPQARRNFWDLIRHIKSLGKTVILTTHYMEEAYELCDEIAIMDHGRIIAQGAPDKLLRQYFTGLTIQLSSAEVEGARAALSRVPGKLMERENGILEIQTEQVNDTFKALVEQGVPLGSVRVRSRDLEDLFLELTGKGVRS